MIWFPELFYRFEEFETANPGQSASVCDVSSIVLESANGYVIFLKYYIGFWFKKPHLL